MIGNLRPASDAEIEQLLARPADVTRFLYGADADGRERVVLNKAWHAIHFVLTGSRLGGEEPLNFLIAEGTPVGEVDVARRVDLKQLDEHVIYPGNWQHDGLGPEDVVSSYRQMRDLIVRLADQGLGMVLYIN
jgi:hypothetical protein